MKANGTVTGDATRALERVLASRVFANSTRLSQFLRFTVEQTLSGNADTLKEYTVGVNAYGRKTDFDPTHDTIVRTEARRLRRKLKEYYETEGKDDELVIFFRSGSYVPVIHPREAVEGSVSQNGLPKPGVPPGLWTEGDGIGVSVTPFVTQTADGPAAPFAFGLTEEILHRLIDIRGVRAFAGSPYHSPALNSSGSNGGQHDVQVIIGGTVQCDKDNLRVIVRVTTANGLVLWSQRFDARLEQSALTKLQEAVAASVLSRVAPRETLIRRFAGTPTDTLYRLYSEVLAAESLIEESSHGSLTKALRKLEELKVRAPDYYRLDCAIAQCCIGLAQRGGYPPDHYTVRAATIARELMVRASDLPEAHSVMGTVLAHEWKWQEAEKSYRSALQLGNQHSIHRQFAIFLLVLGRTYESWENIKIAQEMDPLSIRQKVSMGRFLYYSCWSAESTSYYEDLAIFGDLPLEPAYYQALNLIALGRCSEAVLIADRLHKLAGSTLPYLAGVAEVYAAAGAPEKAEPLVRQWSLLSPDVAYSYFRRAKLAAALEQDSQAVDYLISSLERREPELPWLAVDPRFDRLREHEVVAEIKSHVFAK